MRRRRWRIRTRWLFVELTSFVAGSVFTGLIAASIASFDYLPFRDVFLSLRVECVGRNEKRLETGLCARLKTPSQMIVGDEANVVLEIRLSAEASTRIKAGDPQVRAQRIDAEPNSEFRASAESPLFDLVTKSFEWQRVGTNGPASWMWKVTPTRAGKDDLVVTIQKGVGVNKAAQTVVEFVEPITVTPSLWESIRKFVTETSPTLTALGVVGGMLVAIFGFYRVVRRLLLRRFGKSVSQQPESINPTQAPVPVPPTSPSFLTATAVATAPAAPAEISIFDRLDPDDWKALIWIYGQPNRRARAGAHHKPISRLKDRKLIRSVKGENWDWTNVEWEIPDDVAQAINDALFSRPAVDSKSPAPWTVAIVD